jgi:DNA polymerase-1
MEKKLWNILRDPDCQRCDLWENAQCVCLVGDGPYPTDVMLVGEAPGYREENIRKPFSGRAGELLDDILGGINLDREKIYITNVVHCRPPENKTPNKKQIEACRYFLKKEIEYVKPKKIILMGRTAAIGLLQDTDSTIEELRKKTFEYGKSKVFVTYHPAAALRRPFLTKVIHTDLKNYLFEKTSNDKPVDYRDIKSLEDFKLFKGGFAVDLETEGLNFTKDNILSMSFSPKAHKAYFTANLIKYKPEIKKLMDDPKIHKEAHNLKFDLKFSLSEGFISEESLPRNNFFCSIIAFNILDENYLQKDLEHVATILTSMAPWKSEDDFMFPAKLRLRNLRDADAHRRLYNIFSKRLEKENLWDAFKIDMDMMKVLVSAEYHGIKVDLKELNDLDYNLIKEIKRLGSKIPVEKPNSNQQLSKYFKSLGIKSSKETDGGGPSWDKEVLEKLSNTLEGKQKEALDNLLKWKQLFGIKSKFIDNLREFIDYEGRVHPTFNQVKAFDTESGDEEGTFTGRLSCKNPNLQQTPRDREDLPREINPRRLFVPIHKGGFILTGDYNQIEVRMAAHLAKDENLIRLLNQGIDIHRLIAAEVLKKDPKKITKDERKNIKKVVFGILYMISAWGLSSKLGCSDEEAARYIRFFFRAFPAQEDYISEAESQILINQEISNIFGRKRRLPGATNKSPQGRAMIRQGVNFTNQGSSVDVVKIAMFRIFCDIIEGGYKSRIFANVHDEIALSGYPGEEDSMTKIFKNRIKDPGLEEYGVKLLVPLESKIQIGPNWLDTKEVS